MSKRLKPTIPRTKKKIQPSFVGAKVNWYYAAFLDAVCMANDCGKTQAIKLIFEAAARNKSLFPYAENFLRLCDAQRTLSQVLTLEELFPDISDPGEEIGPFSWQWQDLQRRGLEPKRLMKQRDYERLLAEGEQVEEEEIETW